MIEDMMHACCEPRTHTCLGVHLAHARLGQHAGVVEAGWGCPSEGWGGQGQVWDCQRDCRDGGGVSPHVLAAPAHKLQLHPAPHGGSMNKCPSAQPPQHLKQPIRPWRTTPVCSPFWTMPWHGEVIPAEASRGAAAVFRQKRSSPCQKPRLKPTQKSPRSLQSWAIWARDSPATGRHSMSFPGRSTCCWNR